MSAGFRKAGELAPRLVQPAQKSATQVQPGTVQAKSEEFPDWIIEALGTIRSRFANSQSLPWDKRDALAYGKLLAPLGEERCAQLVGKLRLENTFRPTVAEVREAIEGLSLGTGQAPAYEIAARTLVTAPKGLPSTGEGPGRDRLRALLDQKRRALGQASAQRPDAARFGETAEGGN